MPDRIEAGTYLVAGAITGGNLKVTNLNSNHIEPILNKLEEAGCVLKIEKNAVEIKATKRIKAVDIKNNALSRFSNRYAIYFLELY